MTVIFSDSMYLQKYETTFPVVARILEIAIVVRASNAQAERHFSRVTWLSTGRKTTTSPEQLEALVTIQELGPPIQSCGE